MMIAIVTTKAAIKASTADSTTAGARDNSMPSADAASISKTTTGKTLAATRAGWGTKANTSTLTAKATSADTAAPSTTIADIAMTAATAITTATTGANCDKLQQRGGCPTLRGFRGWEHLPCGSMLQSGCG